MSVGRMLAVLAAVLSFGALIAVLSGWGLPLGFAVVVSAMAWVGAVAVAVLVLIPVTAVRALLPGTAAWPPRWMVAAALAFGAFLFYPVNGHFYENAVLAEEGGGSGRCVGILPLPQAIQRHAADSEYARFSFAMGCDD
jgi:hypothetical protein